MSSPTLGDDDARDRIRDTLKVLEREDWKVGRHVVHNSSSQAVANGRTPSPGWQKCTAYRSRGLGGLASVPRLGDD